MAGSRRDYGAGSGVCTSLLNCSLPPGEIIGLYTRLEAAIVTIVFEARIVSGSPTLTPEVLEIATFRPEDIPWPDIAFSTTTWALRDWLTLRRPDVRWPDRIAGH